MQEYLPVAVIEIFLCQTCPAFSPDGAAMMMDLLEVLKRLKRSLDGYITYRKIAVFVSIIVFFFLYLAPGALRWLSGKDRVSLLTK